MKYLFFTFTVWSFQFHPLHNVCFHCVKGLITEYCEKDCFDYIIDKIKYNGESQFPIRPQANEEMLDFCIDHNVLDFYRDCCYLYGYRKSCGANPYSICSNKKEDKFWEYYNHSPLFTLNSIGFLSRNFHVPLTTISFSDLIFHNICDFRTCFGPMTFWEVANQNALNFFYNKHIWDYKPREYKPIPSLLPLLNFGHAHLGGTFTLLKKLN